MGAHLIMNDDVVRLREKPMSKTFGYVKLMMIVSGQLKTNA
jgi:hypothetical protein